MKRKKLFLLPRRVPQMLGCDGLGGHGGGVVLHASTVSSLCTRHGCGETRRRSKPISGLTLTINAGPTIALLGPAPSIILNGSHGDYCDFWTDGTNAYQNSVANNF